MVERSRASSDAGRTSPVVPPDATMASLEHLRKLQSVTDAALANLGVEEFLDELLIRVRDALETDTAAILLLDRTKSELVARAAKGLEEEVEQGTRIPVGRGFAGTIAATRQPLAIFDVDHSIVLNPILREKRIRSLLGVPLMAQGEPLGVLHVGTLTPRHFTAEDTTLLQLVGDRVAMAVYVGLNERERAVARTLQRSLLPETLPDFPGLRMAARYLPARGGAIGGDWYDAFVLPGGTVAIAIGDVVGHGLGAATAMAKLRHALRAYALEYPSPGDVVRRLDQLLQFFDSEDMATALYGVVDLARSTFRFASAAHLPPIVRDPDGSVRIVTVEAGAPLGAGMDGTFREFAEPLSPGTAVILCTDGLVERRQESLDDGLRRLSEASRPDLPPEMRCNQIIEELVGGPSDDDVALLVFEVAEEDADSLQVTLRSEPNELTVLRRRLERWLTKGGAGRRLVYDVLAASGEAAANAIEHAYGPSGGTIHVLGKRTAHSVAITVVDFGRWRPPRAPNRGRGIPLMEVMAGSVEIERTAHGTTVHLRWDLGARSTA
jgi:anti-sigma regulatory factor (Ser/Thr protein kinase)/putative methionine-R-sulfoxide reductase with GAF domain